MRTTHTAVFLGALLAAGLHGQGQPGTPMPAVYRVELVMHDANDAAAKSGRHYAMLLDGGGKGTIKIGNRVPVPTGPGGSQFTYVDVGTNIDCRLRESGGKVEMIADMDVSTVLPQNPGAPAPPSPIISQIKINVDSILEPGKRATVASIQDPVTQRNFDVEATVSRVP